MDYDRLFLNRAVGIAVSGIEEGGGPFGAVIARGNEIIAESNNTVVLARDPTAHAEINVIRKASAILGTHNLPDCTLYTSCEPCPMCLGAVYWSGIRKVVYAYDRMDAASAGFSDKFIYDEIMLDASSRHILFLHIPDCSGGEPFKRWEEFEDKISY
ncbi:MAG TPA: tRNA-specific adenosine deaminase [Bacteroidales bacterium]|nr:tRNA-specific adenosine deaminase [Bacteroidales bacterium]